MSIRDQILKYVNAATSGVVSAVKNARGNSTPTVDTSYGANTPSAPVVGAAVGDVNGAYNGVTYGDYIDSSQEKGSLAAELQRQQEYTNADVERERSIVDASSSYEQNKSTYGANAEAMAGMGLTESGYSDYINSQAYAQKRAETQKANAQAAAVKRDADYTYYTYGTGDNIGYIKNAVASGAITEEQGKAQIENIQKNNYNSYAENISYGYADTYAIDKAYSNGEISQAQYDDLKAKWNNSIDTSASTFYNAEGTALLNKSAAKAELDKICNSKWCSDETKSALNALYNSLYTPITKSVSFNNDGTFLFFGSDDLAEAGNNFSVKKGNTIYKIQSGGEVTDTNIKEVASSVGDGGVFGYQGAIYIKKNNRIFKIEKRSNSYTDHYNNLYNVFFGSGDTTSVASANASGEKAKATGATYNAAIGETKTTTTTSTGNGGSITQTNYSYDHGGKSTKYEITDENGNTKTVWSVRGH
jgi:hypothetical protein